MSAKKAGRTMTRKLVLVRGPESLHVESSMWGFQNIKMYSTVFADYTNLFCYRNHLKYLLDRAENELKFLKDLNLRHFFTEFK